MSIQLAVSTRNARLDAIETDLGTAAVLKIRSGSVPADCATADAGTVLASLTLPSDYMNAASGGQKTKLGTWADVGVAAGTAGHFRMYTSGGTVCKVQGTVTATGGGGDLTLDNTSIAVSQAVTITGFTLTDGNA